MKLRIKGNSIRLRLSKSEVESFGKNGQFSDKISFGISPSDKLTYSLETSWHEKVHALLLNGTITVFVPTEVAKNWVESDEVGIEAEQYLVNHSKLRIFVEKDFVCLKPRENEDETDNFLHPNQGESC